MKEEIEKKFSNVKLTIAFWGFLLFLTIILDHNKSEAAQTEIKQLLIE